MNNVLSKKSVPIYTLENILKFPLNPYREFVYHCSTEYFNSLPFKFNLSLEDIYGFSSDEKNQYINEMNSNFKDIKLICKDSSDEEVFLKAEVSYKNKNIGTLTFFRYIDDETGFKSSNDYHLAMTFGFSNFDGFDFIEAVREDNVLNFAKDGEDKETADMIFAHLIGFDNFFDFVKVYKAKILMVKNINTFSEKLIKPYVSDMQVVCMSDEFIISLLCGDQVLKYAYPYKNYMKSIKDLNVEIINKFGLVINL